MILSYLPAALFIVSSFTGQGPGDDAAAALKRLTATASLAAQEYALGVDRGRITSRPEVDEAELFLREAGRAASGLPDGARERARAGIDSVLAMVREVADPDRVAAAVAGLASSLSAALGIPLDVPPDATPSLARGASVFDRRCISCHGPAGRGDGPRAGTLDPPPTDLTDAAALAASSPLDFYRRVTIGVAGTAMPGFESDLSEEDRWAVALYAGSLRLPDPRGQVPPSLWPFSATGAMSDRVLARELAARGQDSSLAGVAAVRAHPGVRSDVDRSVVTLAQVRVQIDSAYRLALAGHADEAGTTVLDAYLIFEGVERTLRSRSPGLTGTLEGSFASYRAGVSAVPAPADLGALHRSLVAGLEEARMHLTDRQPPLELFAQSFIILLREGIEAILIVGALTAFLIKMGAGDRLRDVYYGIGAAVAASVLTAILIETIFHISAAQQELLEGVTMLVAAAVLFYVSYWLLSKMEVARWNRFVYGKLHRALAGGSMLALPAVAFLAVYREGFETVLFYKALFVSTGAQGTLLPALLGMLLAAGLLVIIYLGISRWGLRIPLKPFFGITGSFLYYMAFVFAGKGILEMQGAGLVGTTYLSWAPEIPALGIYGTLEGLAVQGTLLVLFAGALIWSFVIAPRRLGAAAVMFPDPAAAPAVAGPRDVAPAVPAAPTTAAEGGGVAGIEHDLLRSLERMDADLAEVRSEIVRIRSLLTENSDRISP